MVTIIGNGMGDYNFSKVSLDLNNFDVIVCDKNFKEKTSNILKLSYKEAKEYLSDLYYERKWNKVDEYAQRLWRLVENKFL